MITFSKDKKTGDWCLSLNEASMHTLDDLKNGDTLTVKLKSGKMKAVKTDGRILYKCKDFAKIGILDEREDSGLW